MRKFIFALALLQSLPGISEGNMPYCAESVIDIGLDEVTDLGFSARDLLSLSAGQRRLPWSWDYKEEATNLTVRVSTVARRARYIDAVAVYPDGAPEIAIVCPDRVEVDAWVDFATDDGAFAERWNTTIFDTDGTDCMPETGELCVAPGQEANFIQKFDRGHLNGTFYGDVPVPEDLTVDFYAHGAFGPNQQLTVNVFGQAYSCSNDACYSYYIHGGHTP